MVQIKSAPGPVLSARSVYNIIEGDIKRPMKDLQPPINETLARIKDKRKKIKKRVKRLNTTGKKNPIITKNVNGKMLIKMKVNMENKKRTNIKKKATEDKSQIEVKSKNGKNSKETKVSRKKVNVKGNIKPPLKNIKSDNFSVANINSESNFVEKYNDLDIYKDSSVIDASEILERIERTKCKFMESEEDAKKRKSKKIKKTVTDKCEKVIKKKSKLENNFAKVSSMPLLVNKDTGKIGKVVSKKISSKSSTKTLANNKLKKKNLSELKGLKIPYPINTKRNFEELNETTKTLQVDSINGACSADKKLVKKRKIESSLKGERKKKIIELPSQLVSLKNNLLSNFLTCDSYEVDDSQILGESVFGTIINPLTPEDFMKDYWEKKHLLIRAEDKTRFKSILSTQDIDNILRMNNLSYTKNIDITSYTEGKRVTHNPEGRALASVVWDYYNSGCSIRMLNPQTFSNPVWKLLSTLQEYFNSFCGANIYLTPPGTQGFAPHWDDIEAFILQLEGKKRWKVYEWRSNKDTLPRNSSGNFGHEDRLGELLLDCVLEPGDLLYFPRGYIHQAEALDDAHSLHITISTYQKNAWVDLLEKLLPAALENAAETYVEFRRGLPTNYMNKSGIAYADKRNSPKMWMKKKVGELVDKMMEFAPIDEAIDQLAKGSVYDSLPPYLTEDEKRRTIFGGGEKWCAKIGGVVNRKELTPETSVRLLRKGCVRLLVEEDSVRLFHSLENSREYHEDEPKFIEIAPEMAPGIEKLIHSYPEYVTVEDLPLSTLADKMILATGLFEKGILISEHELDPSEIEEEVSNSEGN